MNNSLEHKHNGNNEYDNKGQNQSVLLPAPPSAQPPTGPNDVKDKHIILFDSYTNSKFFAEMMKNRDELQDPVTKKPCVIHSFSMIDGRMTSSIKLIDRENNIHKHPFACVIMANLDKFIETYENKKK